MGYDVIDYVFTFAEDEFMLTLRMSSCWTWLGGIWGLWHLCKLTRRQIKVV